MNNVPVRSLPKVMPAQHRVFCLISLLLLTVGSLSFGQAPRPVYQYLTDFSLADTTKQTLKGMARVVSLDGRRGLNMTSIYSSLRLKAHTLKSPQGSVSVWFMPMEDLSTYANKPSMAKSNPLFYRYPILTDNPTQQDVNGANFKLYWSASWHPSLIALFAKGPFYEDAFDMPHKALVSVSHATFRKNTWYQMTLTWNYPKDEYGLFLNGIQIGRDDQYKTQKLRRDSVNTSLYVGNPALSFSDIKFYNQALTPDQIARQFRSEVTRFDAELDAELRHMYAGAGRKPFRFQLDPTWHKKLSLSLTKPSDLDSFYVQGKPVKVAIQKEGLLIETINKEMTRMLLDSQVYVWSRKPFEGNLYVEYEFKVLRPAGLSLLMVQASGMNREDFMADYPLRTNGNMVTVYGEDVRSYHWEYYREMADMRNDLANSGLVKNPFLYPLGFGSLGKPVEKDVWHKLQFLQVGNRLMGAVDGVVMIDATDESHSNNGPVYDFGRIAIRCMLRSKMLFRNLNVYNQPTVKTEVLLGTPVKRK